MSPVRQQLMVAMANRANRGTQADPPASTQVNRGASKEARAKAALAAWESQNRGDKGSVQYERDRILLREMLGLA
jgi:hypothetical protein